MKKRKRKFRLFDKSGRVISAGHLYDEGNVQLDFHREMRGAGHIQFQNISLLLTSEVGELRFIE